MTENSLGSRREVDQLAAERDERLEELRTEIADLRASRERLVRAADADRRRIERELHGGVQQHLVALAMRLQLAESVLDSDPAAAKALLEELGRDVQDAVDEAGRLAQRIYPPLLEVGFASALRAAAVSADVAAAVEVSGGSGQPPEILHTVYAAWVDALEHASGARASIAVHSDDDAFVFEIVREAEAGVEGLRDRVEALGGELTVRPEPSGGIRVRGSLPPAP